MKTTIVKNISTVKDLILFNVNMTRLVLEESKKFNKHSIDSYLTELSEGLSSVYNIGSVDELINLTSKYPSSLLKKLQTINLEEILFTEKELDLLNEESTKIDLEVEDEVHNLNERLVHKYYRLVKLEKEEE